MARTDTLIQALLPADLASWVRSRAALEGLQISGWVRQLLVRERLRLVVEAWWRAPTERRVRSRNEDQAPFRMERLGMSGELRVEFRWLTAAGEPVSDRDLSKTYATIRAALYEGRFVLRGDPRLWRVIHAMADADAEQGMRLIMEPEHATTARRSR